MLRSCNCRFCSRSSANSDLSCHWWPQLWSPVGHVIPSQHSPAAPKMAVRHHAAPGQEAVAAWGSGCYRTIIARSRLLEDAASIGGKHMATSHIFQGSLWQMAATGTSASGTRACYDCLCQAVFTTWRAGSSWPLIWSCLIRMLQNRYMLTCSGSQEDRIWSAEDWSFTSKQQLPQGV